MFESLTGRFEAAFARVRGRGRLSKTQVEETLDEIRVALLEADVNLAVTDRLLERIRARAIGAEVLAGMSPGHQVVKIVHESLLQTLGNEAVPLVSGGPKPLVALVVGLQGSGKTTSAAKLANHYRESGKSVLLVAADLARPGAVDQLRLLGQRISVPVFEGRGGNPVSLVKRSLRFAHQEGVDVVVIDTAGRLQVERPLMKELAGIARASEPDEVLLVLDALTGQQSVAVAEGFIDHISVTGVILTKLDSDARGGAAISVREATGCPIKLVGTGEGIADLEVFHPERMATRILGMGDVLTLIERAEEVVGEEEAQIAAQRLLSDEFTLDDFVEQITNLQRMGSVTEIVGMIPGASATVPDAGMVDREVGRSMAIISSMTPHERANPKAINGSRRRRIARGSGTSVHDVGSLLRQFKQFRTLFRSVSEGGPGLGFPGGIPGAPRGGLPGGLLAPGRRPPAKVGRARGGGTRTKRPRTAKKLQKKKKKKR